MEGPPVITLMYNLKHSTFNLFPSDGITFRRSNAFKSAFVTYATSKVLGHVLLTCFS